MPRNASAIISGIVLIALGLTFFSEKSDVSAYIQKYWWIPLIVLAALSLLETAWRIRKKDVNTSLQFLIGTITVIVGTIGVIFLPHSELVFIMAGLMIAGGVLLVLRVLQR